MKTAIKNLEALKTLILDAYGVIITSSQYDELKIVLEEYEQMIAALDDCLEYFEQRQDADCDQDGYIPNDEMKMSLMIKRAIGE